MRIRLPGDPNFNYQVTRNNFAWSDHTQRLLVTGSIISWLTPMSVCDPACGDGSVLMAANRLRPIARNILSDISVPNIENLDFVYPHEKSVAPIEEALANVSGIDVIVLTEILEHLEDPDSVLALARSAGSKLVASSPLREFGGINNPEHLWGWDEVGYEEMLVSAGWTPISYTLLSWPALPYQFQIWTAQ